MAGDWIKMRTDLYRDPKVTVMADQLLDSGGSESNVTVTLHRNARSVMRNAVVGALVSVWGVVRREGHRDGDDLRIDNATLGVIDDIADMVGFGAAMLAAGWLAETDSALVFPRFFEEHNVDPTTEIKAKNRERQRRFREKKRGESNALRNVTVTPCNAPRSESESEESIDTVDSDFDADQKNSSTDSDSDFDSQVLHIATRIAKATGTGNPRDQKFLLDVAALVVRGQLAESVVVDATEGVRIKRPRKPFAYFRASLHNGIGPTKAAGQATLKAMLADARPP